MARCHGTTKAGARCKRTVAEGREFCSIHASAAAGETPGAESAGSKGDDREKLVASGQDLLHLMIGAAATVVVLWVLKRAPRFPGF